jgi:hypothetical protein
MIKRFHEPDSSCVVREQSDGEYVLHADHVAALETLRAENTKLKRKYDGLKKFRHRKGGSYELLGYAYLQTDTPLKDYDHVAVYRSDESGLWVRPVSEFEDGRFELVAALSPSTSPTE